MISFKNSGEIDIRGVTMVGLSSKPNSENPFGGFGSGWKHAIAGILRLGGDITIWSGVTEYKFTTVVEDFRGEEFSQVLMNGEPISITTHLAAHWEPWMLYREIICNFKDEPDYVESTGVFTIKAGTTVCTVQCDELDKVHSNRDKYFLFDTDPTFRLSSDIEVYENRDTNGIFLKGVMVSDERLSKILGRSYNFNHGITITEDRTMRYSFEATTIIGNAICRLTDKNTIMNMLEARKEEGTGKWTFESGFSGGNRHSDEFKDVCVDLLKNKRFNMFESWKSWLRGKGIEEAFLKYVPTRLEEAMLRKAIEFLGNSNFHVDRYPILLVEDLGTGVEAQAHLDNKCISLSKGVFDKGTRYLASTLLEEYIHLETGLRDETYALQTRLFDMIVKLCEQVQGEPV